jgi:hypothetical protein
MSGNGGGAASVPSNKGPSGAVGQEDDLSQLQQRQKRREEYKRQFGKLFGGLGGLGGLGKGKGAAGGRGTKNNFPAETMIADTAGQGATEGLPTADENGEVSMVFRQVCRCPFYLSTLNLKFLAIAPHWDAMPV